MIMSMIIIIINRIECGERWRVFISVFKGEGYPQICCDRSNSKDSDPNLSNYLWRSFLPCKIDENWL